MGVVISLAEYRNRKRVRGLREKLNAIGVAARSGAPTSATVKSTVTGIHYQGPGGIAG